MQLRTLTTFVVLGAYFEIIQKEIKHFPVEILHNTNWELGMGASISFGIEHIVKNEKNVEAVLITLVDQPLIDEEHLNSLISKFNKNQEAIIATSMKDQIGVPAIFSKRYFKELLALNEDYGARQIIKEYKDLIIAIDGKDKTYDIDTKEQYKRLSERIKQ